MTPGQRTRDSGDGLRRFQLAIQKSRAGVYLLGAVIAIAMRLLGVFDASVVSIVGIFSLATFTAVVFHVLYERGLDEAWGIRFEPIWLAVDIAIISSSVAISGGITSPWYVWYIANAGVASFIGGRRGVVAVSMLCAISYVVLLVFRGEIRGFDHNLALAVGRMAMLFGAAFFFLRGTADLQEKRRLITILKDNESRKVAELTRLTAALDQRTQELAEASERVRLADRLKSQFLANMSHELRTPLNSIIGFSEILASRLSDQIPAKHLRFLHHINTSGQHLLSIINDILDLSKIEAGKMELHPDVFPLYSTALGVATIMKGITTQRGITISLEIPGNLSTLEADPVKIKQILYNLVSNAVKFSPDNSTVTVRARELPAAASGTDEDSIEIAVSDTGIGIAPEDRGVIFQEFRQADGLPTRRFEGTGLGLALVKKFVELHRGSIAVESAVGKGSTFTVVLPRRFRGAGTISPPDAVPDFSNDSRNRILVVEDDPTAYETLSRDLAAAGYIPVRARRGEEVLALARTLQPAAITLDLVLPGLDGWEVLKELKGDSETRGIPVIIISMLDNRELGLTLGADDYFLKPVDRDQLLSRLESILFGARNEPARILVIDDDPAVHLMLEEILAPQGFRVDHASTGREGLEEACLNPPDLIFLDLMMQGMDGFEVAAALRENSQTKDLPVLVLTAKDLSAPDRDRLRGKIAALMQKGETTPARLISVVGDLVRRHDREERRARI
jgi:signal transduction histidine kinase/DNA-binding response OmpR family regulator